MFQPQPRRSLGQLAPDDPPPIDSMPGSGTSNEAGDQGTSPDITPAVNTLINPTAPAAAGAQSTPQARPVATTVVVNPPSYDWRPWFFAGACIVGGSYLYYRHMKGRRR